MWSLRSKYLENLRIKFIPKTSKKTKKAKTLSIFDSFNSCDSCSKKYLCHQCYLCDINGLFVLFVRFVFKKEFFFGFFVFCLPLKSSSVRDYASWNGTYYEKAGLKCAGYYIVLRYSCGLQPSCERKKRQKNEGLGKRSSSDTCKMLISLWRRRTRACAMMARSIHSFAVMPLAWRTTVPR